MSSDRDGRLAESVWPVNAFPKAFRVRKRKEYQRIFGRGTKIITPVMVFFLLPNARTVSRIGLTVTKKVGGAVTRNRIKRMIRESFRHHRADFVGFDIVAIPRWGAVNKCLSAYDRSFHLLKRQMTRVKPEQVSGRKP